MHVNARRTLSAQCACLPICVHMPVFHLPSRRQVVAEHKQTGATRPQCKTMHIIRGNARRNAMRNLCAIVGWRNACVQDTGSSTDTSSGALSICPCKSSCSMPCALQKPLQRCIAVVHEEYCHRQRSNTKSQRENSIRSAAVQVSNHHAHTTRRMNGVQQLILQAVTQHIAA